jgi:hypothetical protein
MMNVVVRQAKGVASLGQRSNTWTCKNEEEAVVQIGR